MRDKVIKLIVLIVLCVVTKNLWCQKDAMVKDSTIYTVVDELPVLLIDGEEIIFSDLKKFIANNFQFPTNEYDCTGTVYVSFVVEKNGIVSSKKIKRKLCPGFDEEALRVIGMMKKWKPGKIKGLPVRTQIILPIRFYI